MKIYDITMPLSAELPTYQGDPPVRIEPVTRMERGDAANVSGISMSTHSGTHIDVPRHYSDSGLSVDRLPLDLLMGKALVVEMHGVTEIGRGELKRLPLKGEERLLFKTDNSALWGRKEFHEDYAHLTEEGAAYLLELGVQLVGIDYLSIERFYGRGEVHRLLLSRGAVILEGLNLEGVPPGGYELICLPLKIKDGDGAPARAVLRSREGAGTATEFDAHTSKWPLA